MYIWMLTGTPIPNGYEDLFGQMLLLDNGVALERYYTRFRDKYMMPDDYLGYAYKLQPNGADRIEERIKPYVHRLSYTDLPELVTDIRKIALTSEQRKTYDEMKKALIVEVNGEQVTAVNAGVLHGKLQQIATGSVYTTDGEWEHIHDAKLEALLELLEELGTTFTKAKDGTLKLQSVGKPLLVAYHYRHELARLQALFGEENAPVLGNGISEKKAQELQDAWNKNALPMLLVHPASAGHGLNMQKGHASHICWFTPTVDLELFDQLTRRIRRRGNSSLHVVNHILIVENTVDETLTLPSLFDKDFTQNDFMSRLAGELKTTAATTSEGDAGMALKMRKKPDEARSEAEDNEAAASEDTGRKSKWEEADEGAVAQKEDVEEKLTTQKPRSKEPTVKEPAVADEASLVSEAGASVLLGAQEAASYQPNYVKDAAYQLDADLCTVLGIRNVKEYIAAVKDIAEAFATGD